MMTRCEDVVWRREVGEDGCYNQRLISAHDGGSTYDRTLYMNLGGRKQNRLSRIKNRQTNELTVEKKTNGMSVRIWLYNARSTKFRVLGVSRLH